MAGLPATVLDAVIDTSDNNEGSVPIDWPAVYADGISVAFIKVMQSPNAPYPSGQRQMAAARNAGLLVVPYAFMVPCDAAAAVKEFAARCDLAAGEPFALDWEGRQTATAAVVEAIGDGLSAIANRKPVGYWGIPGSTPAFPSAAMVGWDRWVPRYPHYGAAKWLDIPEGVRDEPQKWWLTGHVPAALPLFAQYTAWGRVNGIVGDVDRSVWIGTKDELVAWHKTGALPATF